MELYNINDSEYKNYIKGLCLSNQPIDFYGLKINHMKVLDIFTIGENEYRKMLYPFTLSKELLLKGEKIDIDINLLDLLTYKNEENIYYDGLIKYLCKIFNLKKENIVASSLDGLHNEIIINSNTFITGRMFDQLKGVILFINGVRELKENTSDKPKEKRLTYEQIMNINDRRERDYQMAIYEKNKKEKDEESESVNLYNLYNYISHSLGSIDYERTLNLNIYQLYNTYTVLRKREKYTYDMRLLSSGMISDVKAIDSRLFSERIIDK